MVTGGWRRSLISHSPGLVLLSGDSLLLGIASAEAGIDTAEGLQAVIVGLEGFVCDGRSIIPQPDRIADLGEISGSWVERVRESAIAARAIVRAWSSGTQFVEFVIWER